MFEIQTVQFNIQNVHQGYPRETLTRFLKGSEGNVLKAHKMVRVLTFLKFQLSLHVE